MIAQELETVIKAIQQALPCLSYSEFAAHNKISKSLIAAGAQVIKGTDAPATRYYNKYYKCEMNGIIDLHAMLNKKTFAIEVRLTKSLAGCQPILAKLCAAPHDYSILTWGYRYYSKPEKILRYKDSNRQVILITHLEVWLVNDHLNRISDFTPTPT